MVPGGDNVHAGGKEFGGGLGREAGPAGRVLAVGNNAVQAVLFAQGREERLNSPATGPAHDVADEEQFHAGQRNDSTGPSRIFSRLNNFRPQYHPLLGFLKKLVEPTQARWQPNPSQPIESNP
jgi:hypothetical protein